MEILLAVDLEGTWIAHSYRRRRRRGTLGRLTLIEFETVKIRQKMRQEVLTQAVN